MVYRATAFGVFDTAAAVAAFAVSLAVAAVSLAAAAASIAAAAASIAAAVTMSFRPPSPTACAAKKVIPRAKYRSFVVVKKKRPFYDIGLY